MGQEGRGGGRQPHSPGLLRTPLARTDAEQKCVELGPPQGRCPAGTRTSINAGRFLTVRIKMPLLINQNLDHFQNIFHGTYCSDLLFFLPLKNPYSLTLWVCAGNHPKFLFLFRTLFLNIILLGFHWPSNLKLNPDFDPAKKVFFQSGDHPLYTSQSNKPCFSHSALVVCKSWQFGVQTIDHQFFPAFDRFFWRKIEHPSNIHSGGWNFWENRFKHTKHNC